jgi:hypothetical protein
MAAQAAGLTVDTATFDFAPNLASFPVGPATFAVAPGVAYSAAANGRLETEFPFKNIPIDFTAGSSVFGLCYDYEMYGSAGEPRFQVTDVDNEAHLILRFVASTGFLGIIGTSAFDPSNPQYGDGPELYEGGGDMGCSLDNLSVASAVPEPGSMSLAALPAAALLRRTRPGGNRTSQPFPRKIQNFQSKKRTRQRA